MLVVEVKVRPYGIFSGNILVRLSIINDVSHADRPAYGNYKVELDTMHGETQTFYVKDHKRDLGFWPLISKAIDQIEGKV